jgi:hypothetical protein
MSGFIINNAWLTEFDAVFHDFLKYQGGTLIGGTMQEPVVGASKFIRQTTVGDAHFIGTSGGITEYATQKFDRRKLEPRDFACPIMLDDIDLRMMGTPSVDQYASSAANSCGKLIDQIIIEGLGGKSYSEAAGGYVYLPDYSGADVAADAMTGLEYIDTQVIPWCDYQMGDNANGTASLQVQAGLNSAKIAKAVMKLRKKFNYGPIICVGSEYAMMTMRADPKVSNSDFSPQHSLADGFLSAWGGVDAYIACELVDGGKSHVTKAAAINAAATGPDVEYAYVYSVSQIKLGVGAPLFLKNGLNAERYLNNVLIYQGAYDCTRMFEESVVRIEVLKDTSAITGTADQFKPYNFNQV